MNDISLNFARIAQRVLKGGHDIPRDKVIRRYKESQDNFIKVFELFDSIYVVDDSSDKFKLEFSVIDKEVTDYSDSLEGYSKAIKSSTRRG